MKTILLALLRFLLSAFILTVALPASAQTVKWAQTAVGVDEEAGRAVVELTFDVPLPEKLVLTIQRGGAALGGSDYTGPSFTDMEIPEGSLSHRIELTILNDNLYEPDETLTLRLTALSSGSISGSDTCTVTISDNDAPPVVRLTHSELYQAEDGDSAVEVTLNSNRHSGVILTFQIGGSAQEGDVTFEDAAGLPLLPSGGMLQLPIGTLFTTDYFVMKTANDSVHEPDETVVLTLVSAVGAQIDESADVYTRHLVNDDAAPQISVLSTVLSAVEGDRLEVRFGLSGTSASEIDLPLTLSGTANDGTDYTIAARPFRIQPGAGVSTLSIPVLADGLREGPETLRLTLGTPSVGTFSGSSVIDFTLQDADPLPEVRFDWPSTQTREGRTVNVGLSLSHASTSAVTVPLVVGGTATPGSDYLISSSSVTIPAGATGGSVSLTILTDSLSDSGETITLSPGTVTNAETGTPASHTVTIATPREISFSAVTSQTDEGTLHTIQATLDAASPVSLIVPFALGGTAVQNEDYAAPLNLQFVFPANQTAATVSLDSRGGWNDSRDEPVETIVLTLRPDGPAQIGANGQHTVILVDDDATPTVQITQPQASLTEFNDSVFVFCRLELSAISANDVNVTVQWGGSATNGVDYHLQPAAYTIPAGSPGINVRVRVREDGLYEGTETMTLSIVTADKANPSGLLSVTVPLNDKEPKPVLAALPVRVKEADGTTMVRLLASQASQLPITATLTRSGSATAGLDFQAGLPASVTFPAGQTLLQIPVTTMDDTIDEDDETVLLTLTPQDPALAAAGAAAGLTIEDNEALPVLTFPALHVVEGESGTLDTVLPFQLSGASGRAVSFTAEALSGTAVSGSDFKRLTGSSMMAPGLTAAEVTLQITATPGLEPDESFTVRLPFWSNVKVPQSSVQCFIYPATVRSFTRTAVRATMTLPLPSGRAAVLERSTDLSAWTPEITWAAGRTDQFGLTPVQIQLPVPAPQTLYWRFRVP